ncbi:Lipocalin-like domain-containing protein [Aspergillus carlsbadensis]|nr:Lipocalin-like domain-containing protein [Aspergillus carlsbadensis]
MTTHPIHGAWTLVSFDLHLAADPTSAPILQPLGPDPLGSILFSPTGYMSCTLTSRDAAAPLESPSWVLADDEEILRAARRLTTYCGYYDFFEEGGEKRLSTHVDIALDPNWIGKPQVRRWEVLEQGGKTVLVLRPVQELLLPDGTKTLGRLVWERSTRRERAGRI